MYDEEKKVVTELLQLMHDDLTSMAECVAMVKKILEDGGVSKPEDGQKLAN